MEYRESRSRVINEYYELMESGNLKESPMSVRDFMWLERLERIAQSLERLAGCVGDKGHFVVNGDIGTYYND